MTYGIEFFDTYIERRGTRSVKWDGCNEKFGVPADVEMLPMWIADMDFPAPREVVEAVTEAITIAEKTGRPALEVFEEAMNNIMPVLEVKARRVGGSTYQVPIEIRAERRQTLGLRWPARSWTAPTTPATR